MEIVNILAVLYRYVKHTCKNILSSTCMMFGWKLSHPTPLPLFYPWPQPWRRLFIFNLVANDGVQDLSQNGFDFKKKAHSTFHDRDTWSVPGDEVRIEHGCRGSIQDANTDTSRGKKPSRNSLKFGGWGWRFVFFFPFGRVCLSPSMEL